MNSLTTKLGRPEEFPSDGHVRVLRSIISGASNRSQISIATGISKTQCIRLVDRLIQAKMLSVILGGLVEDAHPLTAALDITEQGRCLLGTIFANEQS